ncbi:MAG: ribosome small subunit-dependent GTPase A [Acidobacteriota bacterium]
MSHSSSQQASSQSSRPSSFDFDKHSPPLLQEYGWHSFVAESSIANHYREAMSQWSSSGSGDSAQLQPARVLFRSLELYRVITAAGEREAEPSGRLRSDGELPAVGDWVLARGGEDGPLQLVSLLPRRTSLSRKVPGERTVEQVVAANVDTVFIVMGLDGDFSLRRLERFSVMVWESGAQPVAVLTKADLHEDPAGARLDAQMAVPGVPVMAVSSLEGTGLDPLQAYLEPGRTVALIGSSGVGKSTLVNRLCGSEVMKTGAVREGDDRGRHTTTHRQLVPLPGGALLIDNPGVREIQLWAGDEALSETFGDIDALARNCRFRDCSHEGEPGCAVESALESGALDAGRMESWRKLQRELHHLERQQNVVLQRQEDKRWAKIYRSAQAAKRARKRGR